MTHNWANTKMVLDYLLYIYSSARLRDVAGWPKFSYESRHTFRVPAPLLLQSIGGDIYVAVWSVITRALIHNSWAEMIMAQYPPQAPHNFNSSLDHWSENAATGMTTAYYMDRTCTAE